MSMKIDQYFWIRPFKTERNANHVIHACVNYKASVRLNPKKEDDFFFFWWWCLHGIWQQTHKGYSSLIAGKVFQSAYGSKKIQRRRFSFCGTARGPGRVGWNVSWAISGFERGSRGRRGVGRPCTSTKPTPGASSPTTHWLPVCPMKPRYTSGDTPSSSPLSTSSRKAGIVSDVLPELDHPDCGYSTDAHGSVQLSRWVSWINAKLWHLRL